MDIKGKKINLIGAVVLLASFSLAWLWLELQAYALAPLHLPEDGLNYVIEPGMNLNRIARDLANQGAIDSPRKLVWLARLRGEANHIRLGEYELKPGTTVEQMLEKVVRGEVKLHYVTLVEGWNYYQVMAALHAEPALGHRLLAMKPEAVMAELGHPGQHPEGRFFPDTYQYTRGMNDVDILKRAYDTMQTTLQAEWAQRDQSLPYKDAYQALTMASIVEKETAVPSERQAIAGVFVRRLYKGMRLQTDPTIIYGIGPSFDGNLTKRHLQDADNPYNTYQLKGLPPTPIAMPGREAIHAALHPGDGSALYFVARGDGSHHFSATLEEHNQAVIKYQLKGRVRATTSMKADGTAIRPK